MFWFIYIWFFFFKIVSYFIKTIEKIYNVIEQPSSLRRRRFYSLGYLEKLFLSVFYRDYKYSYSFFGLLDEDSIYIYRRTWYPYIFCCHIFLEKNNFEPNYLKESLKLYKYFRYSPFFKKFVLTKNIFDDIKYCNDRGNREKNNFFFFLIFEDLIIKEFTSNIDFLHYDLPQNENNLEHMFAVFMLLQSCNSKAYFFKISYYRDWYEYTFGKHIKKYHKKIIFSGYNAFLKKKFRKQKKENFKKYTLFYKTKYKLYGFIHSIRINYCKALKKLFNNDNKIVIFKKFKNYFKTLFFIKFKDSSNIKNISYKNLDKITVYFIRKNRIFNKGRYSRNRQLYRTGVYWCLWLNIIVVYGLYFLFYRFSFNFGYIWLGMGVLILSTILGRVAKYNFYNIFFLRDEFFKFKDWLFFICLNLIHVLNKFYQYVAENILFLFFIRKKRKIVINKTYLFDLYNYLFVYYEKLFESVKNTKRIYIWQYMLEKDDSIFRYKTFFHVIKQIYKSITY